MKKNWSKTGDFGKVITLPFFTKIPFKNSFFYIISTLLMESQADLNVFMAYLE